MKKVVISYCQYGGGHLSAAKNIQHHIEKNYPNTEVILFDFMRYVNRVVDKVSGNAYNKLLVNMPWFWGKIYYHTQDPIFEKILSLSNKLLSYKLRKILNKYNPDIIISTHFFVSHTCSILKKNGKLNAKVATIITDYGVDPYNEWIAGHQYIDYIFVGHDEMKNGLIKKGVSENKIFPTGIPVSDNFLIKYDKREILKNLGLKENKKTLLFFGGRRTWC